MRLTKKFGGYGGDSDEVDQENPEDMAEDPDEVAPKNPGDMAAMYMYIDAEDEAVLVAGVKGKGKREKVKATGMVGCRSVMWGVLDGCRRRSTLVNPLLCRRGVLSGGRWSRGWSRCSSSRAAASWTVLPRPQPSGN